MSQLHPLLNRRAHSIAFFTAELSYTCVSVLTLQPPKGELLRIGRTRVLLRSSLYWGREYALWQHR